MGNDVRRNVAILTATRGDGVVFSRYAVSGINAPGMNPTAKGAFVAVECVDGLGECYLRDHDAEFKLVSELCATQLGVCVPGDSNREYCGRITLWSKKPLCISCTNVVRHQLPFAAKGMHPGAGG